MNNTSLLLAATLILALACSAAPCDDMDIDWYTIDCGGEMWTAGGNFEVSGTIGQPDAGLSMNGGEYELTGGFWPGTSAGPPEVLGDLNCDGALDLFDIDPFVLALASASDNPPFASYYAVYPNCNPLLADIDQDSSVDLFDIDPFVALLTGP